MVISISFNSLRILKEIWIWVWFWEIFYLRRPYGLWKIENDLSKPIFFWKLMIHRLWEKYRKNVKSTLGAFLSIWFFFPDKNLTPATPTYLWERNMRVHACTLQKKKSTCLRLIIKRRSYMLLIGYPWILWDAGNVSKTFLMTFRYHAWYALIIIIVIVGPWPCTSGRCDPSL